MDADSSIDAKAHSKPNDRHDGTALNTTPYISVIIPVLNEARGLPAVLRQLAEQLYPWDSYEVIVADGGSVDGTRELVQTFALTAGFPVSLVDNPAKRSGPGRNAGIRAAKGDIIVFIDGHCEIASSGLLRNTAEIFHRTGAACLCRPQPLVGTPGSHLSWCIAQVRASTLGHGRDSLIYDMNFSGFTDPASSGASYLRPVLEAVGYYDESFDACEDVELNTRVALHGFKAYSDPSLAVYYEARTSFKGLIRQMVRYGRGRIRLNRKHRRAASLSGLAPLGLLLYFLMLPVALMFLLFTPALPDRASIIAAAAIPALLYSAVVVLASLKLSFTSKGRCLFAALAIYPAIHLGLGSGMLMETFSPRSRK